MIKMWKLLAILMLTALALADDGFTFELNLYNSSSCNTPPESANITGGVCNTAKGDSNNTLNLIVQGDCSHMSATVFVNDPNCSGIGLVLPVNTSNAVCNSDLNGSLNFTVTDCHKNSSSSSGDLSAGAIVGIVFGVVAVMFALSKIV